MIFATIALRGYADPDPPQLARILETIGGVAVTLEQIVVFDETRTDGWRRAPRCVWTVSCEETANRDLRAPLRRVAVIADAIYADAEARNGFDFELSLTIVTEEHDDVPGLHIEPDVMLRLGQIGAAIDVVNERRFE